MRSILAYISLLLSCNIVTGQSVYKANREEYKLNKFTYKFYILKDSSCFLKGYNQDNYRYFLYKGRLNKIDDTSYVFKFQPLVKFTSNRGYHTNDSFRFYLNEIDTSISSMTYRVKVNNESWQSILLNGVKTTLFVRGISKQNLLVDTKFIDPLTKNKILVIVHTKSDPDFTYYGSNTEFSSLKISLIKNKLTVYPDHKHIHDKDTFEIVQ